jgi:hypothetical protein
VGVLLFHYFPNPYCLQILVGCPTTADVICIPVVDDTKFENSLVVHFWSLQKAMIVFLTPELFL